MTAVRICPREPELLEATGTGRWDEELRAHHASCRSCAEAIFVATLLREGTLEPEQGEPLPDPGPIWWKAQLTARRKARRRADKPIALAEWAGQLAGIAVGGVMLIWNWKAISGWLSGVFSMFKELEAMGAALESNPLLVLSLALMPLIYVASILVNSRVEE